MKKILNVLGFVGAFVGIITCSLLMAGCVGFAVNSFINATRMEYPIEHGFQKPIPRQNNQNHQKIKSHRSVNKIEI